MKKMLFALLFFSIYSFSQTGIMRNSEGVHVPSATTLEQGSFSTAIGMESTNDGEPLILGGVFTIGDSSLTDASRNAPSTSFSALFAYGVLQNIEIGTLVPIHYDGEVGYGNLDGTGLGDIQFYLKGSLSPIPQLYLGGALELYAPSGASSVGYKPRHVWYFQGEKATKAYTSGSWSIASTFLLSLNKFNVIHWNNYIGILKSLGNSNLALLWGLGLTFFPNEIFSFSLEVSGETRLISKGIPLKPIHDPIRLSPGIRLHLPKQTDLAVGIDLGLGFFNNLDNNDGISIHRITKGKDFSYQVAGSPKFGVSVILSKTFDFSWKDSDQDGVFDRKDFCPNTSFGMTVNQRGCPVDEDLDGVLNIVDECPNTPNGLEIDYKGCPLDIDNDGVPDYQDACPETKEGEAVNNKGCMKDSDGDGIDDNSDKCPKSGRGERVNKEGCSIDNDQDGVLNENDMCPNTSKNFPVDQSGCPLDFDKDGVPDILDNCPNSLDNETIGENGCPLDSDMDGVPDSKDMCPNTPSGITIGFDGCPSDRDKDGVPDILDKCPNTQPRIPVDTIGCNRDSDKDGIPDYMDKCPKTFPNIKVDASGCAIDKKNNLEAIAQRVTFNVTTKELTNSSYTALNDVILLMRKYKFKLTIVCKREDIANAIAEYFDSKGFINKLNIQIKSGSSLHFIIDE